MSFVRQKYSAVTHLRAGLGVDVILQELELGQSYTTTFAFHAGTCSVTSHFFCLSCWSLFCHLPFLPTLIHGKCLEWGLKARMLYGSCSLIDQGPRLSLAHNLQWLPIAHGKQKTLKALQLASDTFPDPPSPPTPESTLCLNRKSWALLAPGLSLPWTLLLSLPSRHSPIPTSSMRICLTVSSQGRAFCELLAFSRWGENPVWEPDRPGLESQLSSNHMD